MGVTNYFSGYVPKYAELAAPLSAKLCVNREDGKKGSRKPVSWKDGDVRAFEEMKRAMTGKLELFWLDPDKPFILRADASDRAIQRGSRVFAARLGAGVPPHPAGSECAEGLHPSGGCHLRDEQRRPVFPYQVGNVVTGPWTSTPTATADAAP